MKIYKFTKCPISLDTFRSSYFKLKPGNKELQLLEKRIPTS